MSDLSSKYLKNFETNGTASSGEVASVEDYFQCSLSQSYKAFMTSYDGGEGFIGSQYLILWRARELIEFNREYEVSTYAPGLLLFGSSGGGEAFGFDLRDQSMTVFMVPFVGMGWTDARLVASDFDSFLARLSSADATLF